MLFVVSEKLPLMMVLIFRPSKTRPGNYSGFLRKARFRKWKRFGRQKGCHGPSVPCVDRGKWDENATASVIMCSLFVNNIIYRTPYFVTTVLRKLMPYTLLSHTDTHAVRGRPTINDVERFWNGRVHEFYSLKAGKV